MVTGDLGGLTEVAVKPVEVVSKSVLEVVTTLLHKWVESHVQEVLLNLENVILKHACKVDYFLRYFYVRKRQFVR